MRLLCLWSVLFVLNVYESRRVPRGFDDYYSVEVMNVIDGDNIVIRKMSNVTRELLQMRLADIYSPKLDQNFGVAAKEHLKKLLRNGKRKKVEVAVKKMRGKIYGRLYIGRRNINLKMISDGYAWCNKKERCPLKYKIVMKYAKMKKRGLWKEKHPIPPWKWSQKKNYRNSTKPSVSERENSIPVTLNRVIDGDTVYVIPVHSNNNSLIKVRMSGIDSPEMKQSYGPEAKNHLETIFYNLPRGELSLINEGIDKYKRTLGVIWSGTIDINKKMVTDGYAWCYRNTQCPKSYQVAMKAAKDNGKGLFIQNNPVAPWDWRKQQKT